MEKQTRRQFGTLKDYQTMFNSEMGQRVLKDLMRQFHMQGSTVWQRDDAPVDVNRTLIREGERNVILFILSRLKVNVKQLHEMVMRKEREDE